MERKKEGAVSLCEEKVVCLWLFLSVVWHTLSIHLTFTSFFSCWLMLKLSLTKCYHVGGTIWNLFPVIGAGLRTPKYAYAVPQNTIIQSCQLGCYGRKFTRKWAHMFFSFFLSVSRSSGSSYVAHLLLLLGVNIGTSKVLFGGPLSLSLVLSYPYVPGVTASTFAVANLATLIITFNLCGFHMGKTYWSLRIAEGNLHGISYSMSALTSHLKNMWHDWNSRQLF